MRDILRTKYKSSKDQIWYQERELSLHALGFKNYTNYIHSQVWRKRRKQWYQKNPDACCFICGKNRQLILHHITYIRIGNELDQDLISLCYTHHARVHSLLINESLNLKDAHVELYKHFYKKKPLATAEVEKLVASAVSYEPVPWIDDPISFADDERLGYNARHILIVLAHYANPETWECWPSMRTLSERTGIHTRAIKRAIDELEHNARITVLRGDLTKSNRYHLLPYHQNIKKTK